MSEARRISGAEIINEYLTAIAQGEGCSPDEIPAFVERQKKLLAEKMREIKERASSIKI